VNTDLSKQGMSNNNLQAIMGLAADFGEASSPTRVNMQKHSFRNNSGIEMMDVTTEVIEEKN
jgi:hypothetical protein